MGQEHQEKPSDFPNATGSAVPVEVAGLAQTLAIVNARLQGYGRRVRYEWITARLILARNVVLSVAAAIALLFGVWVLWTEIRVDGLQLEDFEVPKHFADKGYSGRIVARRVADGLTSIRNSVSTTLETTQVSMQQLSSEANVRLPIGGISVDSVLAHLRRRLGRIKIVDGELTQLQPDTVALTIRLRGADARTFTGSEKDLDGLFEKAAQHVVLRLRPYILAVYLRQKGDLQSAESAASYAATHSSGGELALTHVLLGNIFRQQKRFDEAIQKYQQAIRTNHRPREAYQELSETYLSQGQYQQAYKVLDDYIRLDPRSSWGYSRKSYVAQLANDFTLSKTLALKALQLNARDPRALSNLNFLATLAHDRQEIQKHYSVLSKLPFAEYGEGALTTVPNALAMSAIALGDHESAKFYAQLLIEKYPSHFSGWSRLSKIALLRHQYDEAIAYARKALERGPNSISSPVNLAEALVESGKWDEAHTHIQETLKRLPRAAGLHSAMGRLRYLQLRMTDAAFHFETAASLAPEVPDYRLALARVMMAEGRLDQAERELETAKRVAPKYALPYVVHADIMAQRSNENGALALYKKALELDSSCAEAYESWGRLLLKQGNEPEAKRKFAEAYALEPWNSRYRQLAGRQEP